MGKESRYARVMTGKWMEKQNELMDKSFDLRPVSEFCFSHNLMCGFGVFICLCHK